MNATLLLPTLQVFSRPIWPTDLLWLAKRLPFMALFFLLGVQSAFSQATSQNALNNWNNLQKIELGSDISVKTRQGSRLQGSLENVSDAGLVLRSNERGFPGRVRIKREIAREDVKEIRMNRRGVSTIVGAAIGAGIGIGIGAAIDAQSRSNEDRGLAGSVFGILGGTIGGGIGHTLPFLKGKKIYVA